MNKRTLGFAALLFILAVTVLTPHFHIDAAAHFDCAICTAHNTINTGALHVAPMLPAPQGQVSCRLEVFAHPAIKQDCLLPPCRAPPRNA